MKKTVMALASLALVAGFASTASAHHTAVQYDFTKNVVVKGTVKEFAPQNPHMRLALVVQDAKGARTIEFEGQSVNNMIRLGFKRGMINVGDVITLNYSPLKSGVEGGFFRSATTAKGEFVGNKPPVGRAPDAAAEQKAAEGK